MSVPGVNIKLDGQHRIYRPGEILSGQYGWDVEPPAAATKVELSVLWRTEGKGDEDLGVHFFDSIDVPADTDAAGVAPDREAVREADGAADRRTARFATQLPNSPLSYDGAIVKVAWCVRVRLFLRDGREVVAEKVFQLGNVPKVRVREPAAGESSTKKPPAASVPQDDALTSPRRKAAADESAAREAATDWPRRATT
ncbi:MAG: hypothetical protein HYS13_25975 [Planctomycetia bacterium]|nr:hypothetical protein [Planctomycetia bacterium]